MDGASKFEEYILSIGYKLPDDVKRIHYSSVDNCRNVYTKDGCEEIIYGLNEYGHPPGLIYPRPNVVVSRMVEIAHNMFCVREFCNAHDSTMDILFQNKSVEDIYNAIINSNIKFEFDLSR